MPTIYEELVGLKPRIEEVNRQQIIEKYAGNKGYGGIQGSKFFDQLWKPFAWAAILGFIHNKRKPLAKGSDSAFNYLTISSNANDIFNALILLAIAREGYEILKDASSLNTIIAEYANGGFEIVFTIREEKGDSYFDDSSNFLQEILERENTKVIKIYSPNTNDGKDIKDASDDHGDGADIEF